jgi:hypothetical protein
MEAIQIQVGECRILVGIFETNTVMQINPLGHRIAFSLPNIREIHELYLIFQRPTESLVWEGPYFRAYFNTDTEDPGRMINLRHEQTSLMISFSLKEWQDLQQAVNEAIEIPHVQEELNSIADYYSFLGLLRKKTMSARLFRKRASQGAVTLAVSRRPDSDLARRSRKGEGRRGGWCLTISAIRCRKSESAKEKEKWYYV